MEPGKLLVPLPARAFREDAHMLVVADAVGAAAAADDVVVEIRLDLPALRLGIIGERLAAVEALLLAHQGRIDDGGREFVLREHPRRLDHGGGAGAVVIGAGRIGGGVHHVGDAAVDMAGDDDDAVRIGRAALDGDDVADADAVRAARAGEILLGRDDGEAAAAGLRNSGRIPSTTQCSAAPMPRLGSVIDDRVCRVPKLTSFSTMAWRRASLTWSAAWRGVTAPAAEAMATADKPSGRRWSFMAPPLNRRARELQAVCKSPAGIDERSFPKPAGSGKSAALRRDRNA